MRARVRSSPRLEEAMAVAFERGPTVYDAAYVVLAEALEAPLVTADRRLAEATSTAVLLPE
jgi:predicted nucleic acid-binding protein